MTCPLLFGLPVHPQYRVLLQAARDAQLDGQIDTKRDALALVDRLAAR